MCRWCRISGPGPATCSLSKRSMSPMRKYEPLASYASFTTWPVSWRLIWFFPALARSLASTRLFIAADLGNDIFALPRDLYDEDVRRYGFDGMSYEFIAKCLTQIASHHVVGRMVVAHLGKGISMCAMRRSKPRLDHGLFRAGRPANGHAHQPAGPGAALRQKARSATPRKPRRCHTLSPA